jgi:hypothetical protein
MFPYGKLVVIRFSPMFPTMDYLRRALFSYSHPAIDCEEPFSNIPNQGLMAKSFFLMFPVWDWLR